MKYKYILIPLLLGFSVSVIAKDGKGMTWGFAGFSDIPSYAPNQTSMAKLGCGAISGQYINPADPANLNNPNGPPANTTSRTCNAYVGDTSCKRKRYILCVAETNNPYFQRQPPYNIYPSPNPSTPYFGQPQNPPPPFNRRPYKIHHQAHSMPKEFYAGWVDQPVKLTRYKYLGSVLTSPAKGDELCGNGWRMAEFHDGKYMPGMDYNVPSTYGNNWNPTKSGGWSFHAALAADRNMGTDAHPANSGSNARVNFKNNRYWVKSNTTAANCWNP